MARTIFKSKWNNHVGHARKRGLRALTYGEYVQKIAEAGITPEEIGRAAHQYHLARYTDTGDYTVGSCRFIPAKENLAERRINGGLERGIEKLRGRTKETCEGRARSAEKQRGKVISEEAKEKRRATITGRTAETHDYIARATEKRSKNFAFVSPDDVLYTGSNLSKFCRTHGLLQSGMSKLSRGVIQKGSYHGWTLPQHDIDTQ